MATKSFADVEQDEPRITAGGTPADVPAKLADVSGDVVGEILSQHKKLPRLNLSQKTGDLGDNVGGAGKLVLNKEVILLDGIKGALDGITVAKIRLQYQQDLPYDPTSTAQPKTFNTAREVLDAGGSTEYGDENYYKPIAHMLLVVPAPEDAGDDDLENHFIHEFGGKFYAAAVFTAAGSSFTEGAKPVFTELDKPKVKAAGIRSLVWKATVAPKQSSRGKWFALKLQKSGTNSTEFIDWTYTILP